MRVAASLSSLAIVAAIALPSVALAAFKDVPASHPNATAIAHVQAEGIVQGYPDGTYHPDQTINRAEFIKILTYYRFGQQMVDMCGGNSFSDVPMDAWYRKPICRAKDDGLVDGYPDGTFRPEQLINFAEAAKLVAAFDTSTYGGPTLPPATDGAWYERYVAYLAQNRAIPLSLKNLESPVTRGEMAEMIYRLDVRAGDYPSHSYESITGDDEREEVTYEVEMNVRVHSTVDMYRLVLSLESGNATIFNSDNGQALSFDAFYASPKLAAAEDELRDGSAELSDFFMVTDVNRDGFKDISFPSSTAWKQFYFDPSSLLFVLDAPTETHDEDVTLEYCTSPVTTFALLPTDPAYAVFGDLGKALTASDCGTQRLAEVSDILPDVTYARVVLKADPSSDLYSALSAIGFGCNDSKATSSMTCKAWLYTTPRAPSWYNGLKPHAKLVQSSDIRFED